jgi:hypothetical protein
MIPALVIAFVLLVVVFLLHRFQVQEERKDLLLLKRHATDYAEQDQRL